MGTITNRYPTEDTEQIRLAALLDKAGMLWCHVPNGGKRDQLTGARLKRQGVKPGVPDVLIFDLGSNGKPTALELKRQNGRYSQVRPNQKGWLQGLDDRGWNTIVGYGASDAISKLQELGYEVGPQWA